MDTTIQHAQLCQPRISCIWGTGVQGCYKSLTMRTRKGAGRRGGRGVERGQSYTRRGRKCVDSASWYASRCVYPNLRSREQSCLTPRNTPGDKNNPSPKLCHKPMRMPLDESIQVSRIIATGVCIFFFTTTTTVTAKVRIVYNSTASNTTVILTSSTARICKAVTGPRSLKARGTAARAD